MDHKLTVEKLVEMLCFLADEIDWLAARVDSFPPGKLRPEENRRVAKARQAALDLADYLADRLMEE